MAIIAALSGIATTLAPMAKGLIDKYAAMGQKPPCWRFAEELLQDRSYTDTLQQAAEEFKSKNKTWIEIAPIWRSSVKNVTDSIINTGYYTAENRKKCEDILFNYGRDVYLTGTKSSGSLFAGFADTQMILMILFALGLLFGGKRNKFRLR